MTALFDLEPMLRFVRDTEGAGHRMPMLIDRFGEEWVNRALELGLIERQRWLGQATDFIDLSAIGERVLVGIARAQLREKVGARPQ